MFIHIFIQKFNLGVYIYMYLCTMDVYLGYITSLQDIFSKGVLD